MLRVANLRFAHGREDVLKDVSFHVKEGELVFLLGANGAGKSTLFECILNMRAGYTGDVYLDGKNTKEMTLEECVKTVAYIPQNHRYSYDAPAIDIVMMGVQCSLFPCEKGSRQEYDTAMQALGQLGITELAGKAFSQLSSGEQQMVLIARALAQDVRILVMDEPTSNLDFGSQVRLMEKAVQLARGGYSILLSCNSPQQTLLYADRVLALHRGIIVASGRPDDVLNDALLQQLYQVSADFVRTECGTLVRPVKNKRYRWSDDRIRFMEDAGRHTELYRLAAQKLAELTPQGGSVCDAGCGLGFSSIELARWFEQVTAVDISAQALEILAKNARVENIRIIEGDVFRRCPKERYQAMLFCCFGRADEIVEAARRQCDGTVLVIQKIARSHRFSTQKVARESFSFSQLELGMQRRNIPYRVWRESVEFGQPLRSIDDGIRFMKLYNRADPDEVTEEYVKARVVEQEDVEFPYYLPMRNEMGFLAFDAADIPEEENEMVQ